MNKNSKHVSLTKPKKAVIQAGIQNEKTFRAIARQMGPNGPNRQTIANYYHHPDFRTDLDDPKFRQLVDYYVKAETDDVRSLIIKGRQRLHQFLDDPASARQAIATMAIVDRHFNQLQVLESRQPVPDTRVIVALLNEKTTQVRRELLEGLIVLRGKQGKPVSAEKQAQLLEAINRGESPVELEE